MAIPSQAPEPKSTHLSDPSLQPFLADDFDPVDHLNTILPTLTTANKPTRSAVTLPDLSTTLQTTLSQLNAQTSRLSNALTALTDDIIRSGGRLAYEVEVLRGETNNLTETLETELKPDIETFTTTNDEEDAEQQPEYLSRLKTLAAVRDRLEAVTKVFDAAMQWPLAPSELSLTSSLITVSAPDDTGGLEEKGKAHAEQLRAEVAEEDAVGAAERVESLRVLAGVWKGTAEEKARGRVVESLAKIVEEKQKAGEKKNNGNNVRKPEPSPSARGGGVDYRYGDPSRATVGETGGYGFLRNLRNLKNDMYLE